jgi:xanthine dehydrogenase accessory factor
VTEIFEELVELLRAGRSVALASVISASGSTPQGAGARMLVTAGGRAHSTIGGGRFEAAVIEDAKKAVLSGTSVIKEYDLSGTGEGVGVLCGGRATVVIDVIAPPQRLAIFGAGHVGRALAETALGLGFAISVIDDRAEYLSADRFPDGVALHLISEDYDKDIPQLDENTFIAVVTRSHECDLSVLRGVVGADTAYLGMISSKRKANEIFARLRSEGVSEDALRKVHAPIGIDIGSKTPKEIAISILAEIVKVRNARRKAGAAK